MYEDLIIEAEEEGLEVVEMKFKGKIKGLYSDNVIGINENISNREKICTIAEEIGHYHTTHGDILDQSDVSNRKQERQARIWAYKRLVGIVKIINAYKEGTSNRFELAEYLDVTEEFIEEALEYYKQKYGLFVTIDNYVVYFEPLGIMEVWNND